MNKYFNKASSGILKILGKSIITMAKVSPPIISGVSQFIKELGSDSYYVVHGNKKKQKLIRKLNNQNIQFNMKRMKFKSNHEFADACIISGLTASQMLINGTPGDVQEAFEEVPASQPTRLD